MAAGIAPGMAQAVKLANQFMLAIGMVAVEEGLRLAGEHGLRAEGVLPGIERSTGASRPGGRVPSTCTARADARMLAGPSPVARCVGKWREVCRWVTTRTTASIRSAGSGCPGLDASSWRWPVWAQPGWRPV